MSVIFLDSKFGNSIIYVFTDLLKKKVTHGCSNLIDNPIINLTQFLCNSLLHPHNLMTSETKVYPFCLTTSPQINCRHSSIMKIIITNVRNPIQRGQVHTSMKRPSLEDNEESNAIIQTTKSLIQVSWNLSPYSTLSTQANRRPSLASMKLRAIFQYTCVSYPS